MRIYRLAGWLALAGLFALLGSLRYEPPPRAYAVDLPAVYAQIDTTTYGDARIVYKLSTDTLRNSAGDLRRLPDLSAAPTGARWRVIWKPSTFDSVMLVTGDTFALSPMDSADATALATSWGVTDPHTVTLAWHVPPGSQPDPVTNLTVQMASATSDTMEVDWTENDSAQVVSGLDAGGQEQTDTVAAPIYERVLPIEGEYFACVRALVDGNLSDSRCAGVTFDTSTGDWANEPAGYTQITDRGFSAADEDGWSDNEGSADYTVPVVDATAPTSPSNVAEVEYDTDEFTDGSAQCGNCASRSITNTDDLFVAFTHQFSSNWDGHSSGVNKILFISNNPYPGSGPITVTGFGFAGGGINLQMRIVPRGDEGSLSLGSPNLSANLGSATLTRGSWHEIEIHVVNNTPGNFDGECHIWVDGTKTHEYTDVMYFDDAVDPASGFDVVKWSPTYGGVGDDPPPAQQWQYMDHFYISAP